MCMFFYIEERDNRTWRYCDVEVGQERSGTELEGTGMLEVKIEVLGDYEILY